MSAEQKTEMESEVNGRWKGNIVQEMQAINIE
jgi:hypothetical protein